MSQHNISAPRSSVDALAPQFQRKDAFTSGFKRKSVDALNPPYQNVEALAPSYRRVEVCAPDCFNVDAFHPPQCSVDISAPVQGSVDATAPGYYSVDAYCFAPKCSYPDSSVEAPAPDSTVPDSSVEAPAPHISSVEANQFNNYALFNSSVDIPSPRKYAPSTDIVESNVCDNKSSYGEFDWGLVNYGVPTSLGIKFSLGFSSSRIDSCSE